MAWFRLVTALPSAALAVTFLITWIAPYTFGEQVVRRLVLLMLLEFIIIHGYMKIRFTILCHTIRSFYV